VFTGETHVSGSMPPPPEAPPDDGFTPADPGGGRRGPSGNGAPSRSYDRVPPHSLEAEVSVLGAAMLSRAAASEATEVLTPDDFYRGAHRVVFEGIRALIDAGEPIDTVTLTDWLARNDRLDEVGGPAALHDLTVATPTAANAAYYARIVQQKALLRRLIDAGTAVARLGYESSEDAEAVVDKAESLVYEVNQAGVRSEYSQLRDLLNDSFAAIEKLAEQGSEVTGLATGFDDLDRLTSGLQPQNLIILAARPAMGKSSLSLNLAQYVTVDLKKPAIIFTLEMSKLEVVNRMLSAEARIDSNKLKTGRLDDLDWRKLGDALGKLSDAPLFIDDTPDLTLMEIRAKCRRLKQKHGLDLVIVDYLQLMTSSGRSDNRQNEVAEISRGMKMLAKELDVPVIALSQLSRQPESRTDKRPLMSDLRESGCLTGDTRVMRADTGGSVTIGELAATGERDVPIYALGDDFKLVPAMMSHAFSSGTKPVFRLRLASGRTIRASANHPFYRLGGWTRLGDLEVDDRIAVPRALPAPDVEPLADEQIVMLAHLIGDGCFVRRQPLHYTNDDPANLEAVEAAAAFWGIHPRRVAQESWWHVYLPAPHRLTHGRRNPICAWLDELGLFGLRSGDKFLPDVVLRLPDAQLATFLGHLWATDGHISGTPDQKRRVSIYYASSSRRLVDDVRTALLRLGIRCRIRTVSKAGYGQSYQLWVEGTGEQRRFLETVPVHGRRRRGVEDALAALRDVEPGHVTTDTVPVDVWRTVVAGAAVHGWAPTDLAGLLEPDHVAPVAILERAPSRDRLDRAADLVEDPYVAELATSDVTWDRVIAVEPDGAEEVFDATVPGLHNFVADGIVVHNSIEQDADIVAFIYRDEVYDEDSPDKGIAELIVSKHRNGATGVVKLAFLNHLTKFANLHRGTSGGSGGAGAGGAPTPM
jgi:replicative DNA helicase